MKSILDASTTELQDIVTFNSFSPYPDQEGFTLQGIETHPQFEKLFHHRNSPSKLAAVLIRERMKAMPGKSIDELAKDRIAIKKFEIEVREKKLIKQTELYTKLLNKMDDILLRIRALENKLNLLLEKE